MCLNCNVLLREGGKCTGGRCEPAEKSGVSMSRRTCRRDSVFCSGWFSGGILGQNHDSTRLEPVLLRFPKRVITPPVRFRMSDSHLSSDSPPLPSGYPIGRGGRLLLAVWCLFLISGFGLSVYLKPSSRGFGTHEQLGLAPCSFQQLVNLPCPSCGMTTSFSHFVRGQWLRSLQASTTAFVLALVCASMVPWCLASLQKKHLWKVDRPDTALLILMGCLYLVAGVEWVVRLIQS